MLKEYAVDPEVIGSDYQNCRFVLSLFGVDKGRLISRFPKSWKQLVYNTAQQLPDGLKKQRLIEMVRELDRDMLVLSKSNRAYPEVASGWLSKVIDIHKSQPFAAILSDHDELENGVYDVNLLNETDDILDANSTFFVRRDAVSMAEPLRLLATNAKAVRFVDPYFDPSRPKWRDFLKAFLNMIPEPTAVDVEYHTQFRDRPNEKPASPSDSELKRRLAQLAPALPEGSRLRVIRWREKDVGERFHRRFVLTEKAGVLVEGGLDVSVDNSEQTTDMTLIGMSLHRARWSDYNLDSDSFELVKPVLIVNHLGNVEEDDV